MKQSDVRIANVVFFSAVLLLGEKRHFHIAEGLVRITTELVHDRIQDVLNPGMLDGVVGYKKSNKRKYILIFCKVCGMCIEKVVSRSPP